MQMHIDHYPQNLTGTYNFILFGENGSIDGRKNGKT